MFFPDRKLNDPEIVARRLAPEQHFVTSQTGGGYAIVFNIGDVKCAVLVSESGSLIDDPTVSELGATDSAGAGSSRLSLLD